MGKCVCERVQNQQTFAFFLDIFQFISFSFFSSGRIFLEAMKESESLLLQTLETTAAVDVLLLFLSFCCCVPHWGRPILRLLMMGFFNVRSCGKGLFLNTTTTTREFTWISISSRKYLKEATDEGRARR